MYTVLCLIILNVNSDNLTDLRVLQKQSEAILKSLVWGVYRWPISIHFFTYEIQMSIILRKLKTLIKTIIIYDQIYHIKLFILSIKVHMNKSCNTLYEMKHL